MSTAPHSVTIGITDLDRALELFHRRMDLDLETSGSVPPDVLKFWGLPDSVDAPYALLSRGGYRAGKLRLVEWGPVAVHQVRTDHLPNGTDSAFDIGPKSIDFFAPSQIDESIQRLENEGYPVMRGPVSYEGTDMAQVIHAGPNGVPIMVMTRPDRPSPDMRPDLPPDLYSEVVTLSLISDSDSGNDQFYGDLLGLPKTMDRDASPSSAIVVADLTGVPRGTPVHYQMFVEEGQPSAKFVIVRYPIEDVSEQSKRLTDRMRPGGLGVCLYSFRRPNLSQFVERARELDFRVIRNATETAWGKLSLVQGPNEELIEIQEVAHD